MRSSVGVLITIRHLTLSRAHKGSGHLRLTCKLM